MFDSLPHLVTACAVLLVAQMVYVTLGFGAGLVAVGGLSLILPEVQDAVVILLLLNLPAESWVVATSWRDIRWRGVILVLVGVAVGIPLGAALLRFGRPDLLLNVLGGFLVAVGATFLVLPRDLQWDPPRPAGTVVGFASGILTGLFGTGGPPLIVWYRLQGLDKAAFRGTLMAIFLAMTVVRVPSYVAFGLVTPIRLWSSLALLPAVVFGAWLGHRAHLRLDETTYRRMVSVGLILLGVGLLLR